MVENIKLTIAMVRLNTVATTPPPNNRLYKAIMTVIAFVALFIITGGLVRNRRKATQLAISDLDFEFVE